MLFLLMTYPEQRRLEDQLTIITNQLWKYVIQAEQYADTVLNLQPNRVSTAKRAK
jgi:hypothetical protein